MDIEAIEYLKNKGFKYNDYTNEFKSIKEFEYFKNFIQENYKDYNDMIYYFDLNSSIPEIKKYYENKFNIFNTNNHYLIIYLVKFNIIEKGTKLTTDILDSLIKMPTNDNIKCSWNDRNGKTKFTREIKKPFKLIKKYENGIYTLQKI